MKFTTAITVFALALVAAAEVTSSVPDSVLITFIDPPADVTSSTIVDVTTSTDPPAAVTTSTDPPPDVTSADPPADVTSADPPADVTATDPPAVVTTSVAVTSVPVVKTTSLQSSSVHGLTTSVISSSHSAAPTGKNNPSSAFAIAVGIEGVFVGVAAGIAAAFF
ncbi:hypothetical protein BDN72DRAFT_845266 [Pluteus cervinus]|uniref:Uncharacterized protein n=1 Tax=Pluteus cervinus TaxID=181527 RepID=A0ACD3AJP9_9AGAR|nr:hypothetical protein BDN72DRAFT_845266 [Pluteus cervinus]